MKHEEPPDLSLPSSASAALRTFFRIADCWSLTDDQQITLLGCDQAAFDAWRSGQVKEALERDTQLRLSHLFGIYAALQRLLPIPERAHAWIRQPNTAPLFGGASALDRMLEDEVSGLLMVRLYVDAQCED